MNHKKPFSKHKGLKNPADKIKQKKPQQIDVKRVRQLASLFFKEWEIAATMGIPKGTFEDHKRANPEIQIAIDEGRENARGNLRRLQFAKAMKGDSTMLIWLGKQELEQKDRQEISNDPKNPVTFTLSIGNKDIKDV